MKKMYYDKSFEEILSIFTKTNKSITSADQLLIGIAQELCWIANELHESNNIKKRSYPKYVTYGTNGMKVFYDTVEDSLDEV